MADLQAPPRNEWLGKPADWLSKIQEIAQAAASRGDAPSAILNAVIGNFPTYLDKASYGESLAAPPQETGPDPSLAAKYGGPTMDLASLFPAGKVAALVKSLGAGGMLGTMLTRGHLLELVKREPEMVRVLEEARAASLAARKAGGTLEDAWRAGSAKLKGTPYAGWLPATKEIPQDLFEVTDVGAKLNPTALFQPGMQGALRGGAYKGPLGGVWSHPELEKFAPDLPSWNSNISLTPGASITGTGRMLPRGAGGMPAITADAGSTPGLRSTLIHEGQHGVMVDAPGELTGTNSNWEAALLRSKYPTMGDAEILDRSWINYQNDPGEMLARAAEKRRLLPAEDLRNMPLSHELRAQYTPVAPTQHASADEIAAYLKSRFGPPASEKAILATRHGEINPPAASFNYRGSYPVMEDFSVPLDKYNIGDVKLADLEDPVTMLAATRAVAQHPLVKAAKNNPETEFFAYGDQFNYPGEGGSMTGQELRNALAQGLKDLRKTGRSYFNYDILEAAPYADTLKNMGYGGYSWSQMPGQREANIWDLAKVKPHGTLPFEPGQQEFFKRPGEFIPSSASGLSELAAALVESLARQR